MRAPKPGEQWYEEARFTFNERLQTLNKEQLIYIVNGLIDERDGVTDGQFLITEEEVTELLGEEANDNDTDRLDGSDLRDSEN